MSLSKQSQTFIISLTNTRYFQNNFSLFFMSTHNIYFYFIPAEHSSASPELRTEITWC